MKTKKITARADQWFRAFADPTRLRLLYLLTGGERCVCDLVTVLDLPQPTISRHLAYLRRVGLVVARKEGLWSYYRLTEARGDVHQKLLELLPICSQEMPRLANDAKRLKAYANRCCE